MLPRIKKKMNHTELCKWMTKKLKEESTKKIFAERELSRTAQKNHTMWS